MYSWGQNRYGQLGIAGSNTFVQNKPVKMNFKTKSRVVDFACGEEHAALVTESGEVYTWGYGNDG